MSLWQRLFGGGMRPDSAGGEPVADKPRGEEQAVPYGIEERPMPEGDDLEVLLPRQVGSYVRDSIRPPKDIHRDPIYAHYRSGASTVFVELGICGSASGAKVGLSNAKAELEAEFPDAPKSFAIRGDPAYLKVPSKGFFAWTRGSYYYSASASGGEADLDAFMEAFPY